ncbi:MAG: carbohydrate ABC transporter permease [bacterium]
MAIRKSFGSWIFDIANYLFLSFVLFVTLYPFLYVFFVSISDPAAVSRGEVGILPMGFQLATYTIVLRNQMIARAYLNTILYTVFGTFLTLLITCLTAYPLSQTRLRGRKVITVIYAITMFFSGGLIPTFLVVKNLRMVDTIWAIIIPWSFGTWYIIIARTNFMRLPESLIESAYIDGANDWQVLFHVVLPLSKAILATLTLFIAVGFWNNFFTPLIYLNSANKMPLQIVLRQLLMFDQNTIQGLPGIVREKLSGMTGPGLLISINMATIIVATGPIILIYPFVQKYFVKGVLVGAIKG